MSRSSSESRDTQILVFTKMAATLAQALVPFMIAKLLGKAGFGAFGGLWLIYGTLSAILTAGFPAAALYYLADRPRPARAAIARRLMVIGVGMGVVGGAVMFAIGVVGQSALSALGSWVSSTPGDPLELDALRYFALFPVFDMAARIFPNILIAERRAKTAGSFGILRAVGMTIAQVLPASLGGGVPEIVMGCTIYGIFQIIGMHWTLAAVYRGIPRLAPEVTAAQMVHFSVPMGMTEVVSILNAQLDRYLVLVLMSGEAFAEYTAGAWQLPVVAIAYTMGQVYMPRFVRLLGEGKGAHVVSLWRESALKAALVIVPVCMAFFVAAEEFLIVGFSESYVVAAPVFRCYLVYTALRIAPFGSVILAAGQPRLIVRAAVFTLASNVIISVPLAYGLGFWGPALGTMLAFVPTILVYGYFIGQAVGVPALRTFPWLGWLRIAGVALVGSIPAWWVKWTLTVHPALALALQVVLTVPGFILLGRWTGVITAADLREATGWLRLRFFRSSPPDDDDPTRVS